jgi:hypothetical protein
MSKGSRSLSLALSLLGAFFLLSHGPGKAQTANQSGITEPLVIDVDDNGIAISSAGEGVPFALNGPGLLVSTAWTLTGSDDAFVALDVNHNGRIESGLELLGGASPGPNGFATLNYYDGVTNLRSPQEDKRPRDGYLDKDDAIFDQLLLWTDANHNGISEPDELESVSHAGIVHFLLGYQRINLPLPNGSLATFEGQALVKNARGVEAYRKVTSIRPLTSRR